MSRAGLGCCGLMVISIQRWSLDERKVVDFLIRNEHYDTLLLCLRSRN